MQLYEIGLYFDPESKHDDIVAFLDSHWVKITRNGVTHLEGAAWWIPTLLTFSTQRLEAPRPAMILEKVIVPAERREDLAATLIQVQPGQEIGRRLRCPFYVDSPMRFILFAIPYGRVDEDTESQIELLRMEYAPAPQTSL